jgi:hypothetical protein
VSIFRRISRAIGRFNRWYGPTAVASNVMPGGGGVTGGQAGSVNPMGVQAVLGEIEQDVGDAERLEQ